MQTMQRTGCRPCSGQDADHAEDRMHTMQRTGCIPCRGQDEDHAEDMVQTMHAEDRMQTMQRTACRPCRGQDADHVEDRDADHAEGKKIRAERVTEKTLIIDRKARRRVVMGQDKWETPNRMVQVEIGSGKSRQEKGKNNRNCDKKTKENSKIHQNKKLKRGPVTKKVICMSRYSCTWLCVLYFG